MFVSDCACVRVCGSVDGFDRIRDAHLPDEVILRLPPYALAP